MEPRSKTSPFSTLQGRILASTVRMGLVLYFEFSPAFEAAFLEPIGLSRDQITLAFVEGYQFVREGIDVTPIWDGDALTGLIGKVSHLSTIVLVDKKAVQPTDVETSTWAKIKALWR